MADKTVSIKSATDQELNALIIRVRRERDALNLLREQKLQSTPNPKGPYPDWSMIESFSTETPVYNNKSIKSMTDQELNEFLRRLQNESELTRLIRDIKDLNKPPVDNSDGSFPSERTYEGLNLNTPVDNLYHWGIPGMKWGVRRDRTKEQIMIDKKTYETGAATAKEYGNIAGLMRTRKEDRYSNVKRREAKEISDDDLKRIVNRLNMEQQYRNLTTKDVDVGKSRLEDILMMTGSLMTIAATGAGLALTIKQLSPKKG